MKIIPCLRIPLSILFGMIIFTGFSVTKPFEGIITYKIDYPDNNYSESQMAMFPKVLTITIKGDFSKSEIQTPMGAQITITDYNAKTQISLLNLMGQKYAIEKTTDEITKELTDSPPTEVVYLDETKVIAGYTCKKAVVTVDDKGSKTTYEVYYTDELGAKNANFDNPVYKDIPGVLLEFAMKTPQFTMLFTASGVDKQNIPAKEFEIPSEYSITTMEELKSKLGGMQ